MNSVPQIDTVRHVYGIQTWKKILYLLLAAFFALAGAFLTILAFSGDSGQLLQWIMGPAFVAISIYVASYSLRSRMIIEGSRIQVRTAFGEKSADLSEIEGFRTITTRNGSYQELGLKEGRGSITLSSAFSTDDDFRAFLQQIPDLDQRDRDALLAEISNDAELGATPEERLGALKKAKTISILILLIGLAAGVGVNLAPSSWIKPSAVLLALIPVATWFLLQRSPLLYAVFKRKVDPRAELSYLTLIPGVALFIAIRDVHMVSLPSLALVFAIILLVSTAAFYTASHKSSARGAIIGLLIFSGAYAGGVAGAANALFDRSKATGYTVPVVGGHVSSGRSTTYYLRLAPWGPVTDEKDVSVPSHLYHGMEIGDVVCISLHAGALHAPWFTVASCPTQSEPPFPQ
jgi:hypothetical protein